MSFSQVNKDNPVKVSVVLPTYNEAQNIKELIGRINHSLSNISTEIIVVDDDSPDLTWQLAQQTISSNVKVIRRTDERGLVTAIKKGIDSAQGEYVVWMDADLSMPPELIPEMVKQLEENDIVIASRYVKGGRDLRPLFRKVTSKMINLAANIVLNSHILDYTSGFAAVKKEVFKSVSLNPSTYGEYFIEFVYHADRKGFNIKEIPYPFIDRLKGTSKTAGRPATLFKYGWFYFKKILKLKFSKDK